MSTASTSERTQPPLAWLAAHKPLAILARVPEASVLFFAGACAGVLGKTITAPLDRLKIIMQVQGKMVEGALRDAARRGSVVKAFVEIGKQGGVRSYWKGNLPQVIRVVPYSAAQLCGYELFKHQFALEDGSLTVPRKLAAGACAGMLSTAMTYPLDTLRMRLALDPTLKSIPLAVMALLREGGPASFYRGVGAAVIGIAPYMAMELAAYDSMPEQVPSFARGFTAALLASTCFYPLDTVRRQIQIQSAAALPVGAVLRQMYQKQGVASFYRGFLPNALKNLPNKGIRLSAFSAAKDGLASAKRQNAEAKEDWRRSQASQRRSLPQPRAKRKQIEGPQADN